MDEYVGPGERKVIYFSDDPADTSTIIAPGLEACIAIGAKNKGKAAVIHVRTIDPLEPFLRWLSQEMPPSQCTALYVVGGMQGRAEDFVGEVNQGLRSYGYADREEVTLTPYVLELSLSRDRGFVLKQQQHYEQELGLQLVTVSPPIQLGNWGKPPRKDISPQS